MSRRRSTQRRSLGALGLGSDATIGLSMLVAGVGLTLFLWKFNTPSQDDIAQSLKGFGCGDCNGR